MLDHLSIEQNDMLGEYLLTMGRQHDSAGTSTAVRLRAIELAQLLWTYLPKRHYQLYQTSFSHEVKLIVPSVEASMSTSVISFTITADRLTATYNHASIIQPEIDHLNITGPIEDHSIAILMALKDAQISYSNQMMLMQITMLKSELANITSQFVSFKERIRSASMA